MALLIIPLAVQVPRQTQTTTLDGRPYVIETDYNGRLDRWFFSLSTTAGEYLIRSKALVTGSDLLRQVRHNPHAPQGALAVADLVGSADPSFDTLGARHVLLYFTAS